MQFKCLCRQQDSFHPRDTPDLCSWSCRVELNLFWQAQKVEWLDQANTALSQEWCVSVLNCPQESYGSFILEKQPQSSPNTHWKDWAPFKSKSQPLCAVMVSYKREKYFQKLNLLCPIQVPWPVSGMAIWQPFSFLLCPYSWLSSMKTEFFALLHGDKISTTDLVSVLYFCIKNST